MTRLRDSPVVRWIDEHATGTAVWGLAAAAFIAAWFLIQNFLILGDLKVTLADVLFLSFAAAGETFVLIGGGIDISVQGMMSGSLIVCADLANGSNAALLWVIPLILGGAVVVGLVNGMGVTWLKVPPIMMTLATNTIVEGGSQLITGGGDSSSTVPSGLVGVAYGTFLGIPWTILILGALSALMWFVLSVTTYGRRLYSVGASAEVSRFSGLNGSSVIVTSYVCSAIGGALAGIVLLADLTTPAPGAGDPYLFTALAAVVLGGVSIAGGKGSFSGPVGAVIFLTLLTLLFTAESIGVGTLDILFGVAILACVWLAARRTVTE